MQARKLGREFVVQVTGTVAERSNKNPKLATGDIEIIAESITVLNTSDLPPFTIEENTDGGDELRMKYRYLDLRRQNVRSNIILRHKMAQEVRRYLDGEGFIEVETPVLIKSTPEGARDFVVPSRLHHGEFYALPQSPQTFKQLLMVAGFDKYFQIVKCFRDEDLRADRQPEFTQIDCEMSFIHQDDILNTFEGLASHLFREIKGIEFQGQPFPRIPYDEAMSRYGIGQARHTGSGCASLKSPERSGEGIFRCLTAARICRGHLCTGVCRHIHGSSLMSLRNLSNGRR